VFQNSIWEGREWFFSSSEFLSCSFSLIIGHLKDQPEKHVYNQFPSPGQKKLIQNF